MGFKMPLLYLSFLKLLFLLFLDPQFICIPNQLPGLFFFGCLLKGINKLTLIDSL